MKSSRLYVFLTSSALSLAVLAGPASAEGPTAGEPVDLEELRERLAQTETPEQWERTARDLLAELDQRGLSDSPEAHWLVEQLIGVAPEDPVLLWRRAETERRNGRTEAAIADLEYLTEMAPEHPLAVRARRALPALYLRVQEPAASARADEQLLAQQLADPVAVSIRLARTYAALDRPEEIRRTLDRLAKLAPDKLESDPELMWRDARAAEELGHREVAADKLLRFANLHARDPRRTEALVRASRLYAALGRRKLAIGLLEEVIASEPELNLAMDARLRLARLFQESGRGNEASRQLRLILDEALDPETVAAALRLLLDATEAAEGLEAAVAQAASLVAGGDRFHDEMARNHLDRLMRELEPQILEDPPRLLYYYDLLRSVEQERALSAQARLIVGRLLERAGLRKEAETLYRALLEHFGPERQRAHDGLVRTAPAETTAEGPEQLRARLVALARDEQWPAVREVVEAGRLAEDASPEVIAIAARAFFASGSPAAVRELLDRVEVPAGELAALRGDARALTGDWEGACGDYRRAAEPDPGIPLTAWVQWRLALCDVRADRQETARERLTALESGSPGPPVEALAEMGPTPPGPAAELAKAEEGQP
jgi:tetratricopeptide (TPR) repeat protein